MVGSISSPAVAATILTVGPDGTYPTIQAAINAAIVSGTSTTIEVESGTYFEHLSFTLASSGFSVVGGYDNTFTLTSFDPSTTQIFASGTGRALDATVNGGAVQFNNVTFAGGSAAGSVGVIGGGGVRLSIGGGLVQIYNTHVSLNSVQATASAVALGGGIYAAVSGSGTLNLQNVAFGDNGVSSVDGNADGGGINVTVADLAAAYLSGLTLQSNHASTSGSGAAVGGGADFTLSGAGTLALDNVIAQANTLSAAGLRFGSGLFEQANCASNCRLSVIRSLFDGNTGGRAQVDVDNDGPGGVQNAYFADVLITHGDTEGLLFQLVDGVANLTNLTVADNSGPGIHLIPQAPASLTLFNTISHFNNGTDLTYTGSPVFGNNLFGVDPVFVDRANGDYRIRADSPARDAGDDTPLGALPATDLDFAPRVFGPHVDIGAYEVGDSIFANGFD